MPVLDGPGEGDLADVKVLRWARVSIRTKSSGTMAKHVIDALDRPRH